jgi:hypothetical protein
MMQALCVRYRESVGSTEESWKVHPKALPRFNARIHQHNNAKAEWIDTHRAQLLQLLRQRRDGGPLVGVRPLRLRELALQLSELLLQPGHLRAVAATRLYPNHTARQRLRWNASAPPPSAV